MSAQSDKQLHNGNKFSEGTSWDKKSKTLLIPENIVRIYGRVLYAYSRQARGETTFPPTDAPTPPPPVFISSSRQHNNKIWKKSMWLWRSTQLLTERKNLVILT